MTEGERRERRQGRKQRPEPVELLKHWDGITEDMKTANQLEWVQRMNVIRYEAAAAVTGELICV